MSSDYTPAERDNAYRAVADWLNLAARVAHDDAAVAQAERKVARAEDNLELARRAVTAAEEARNARLSAADAARAAVDGLPDDLRAAVTAEIVDKYNADPGSLDLAAVAAATGQ